jgi:anti-sigma28 factor (negative regulator of flagellin synthesis)
MSTQKISAAKAAAVYAEVPGVLLKLASERDKLRTENRSLREKVAEYERSDRIEKIARAMHEKGIDVSSSMEDKVERIKEAAERGRSLDVIEEAVEMTAPNGGFAKLAEDVPGNGGDQLTAYLLGGLSE